MSLEHALADWRGKAETLRRTQAHVTPDTLERCLRDIEQAAEPYLRWLNEVDAHLYSGKSLRWLRGEYPRLAAAGDARKVHGKRFYRMAVLPVKPNVEALLAQAERDAKEDAA
jgi:hypothetical protein